jgi:hypothetical protein
VSLTPEIVFQRLDMLAKGSGLFRVDSKLRTERERATLGSHPWRARLEAFLSHASEHQADWVYFRLEADAGGPKPEIFVYDRCDSLHEGGDLDVGRLHLELWNYAKVPLAFVLRSTTVDVLNLLEPPLFDDAGQPLPPPIKDHLKLTPAEELAAAGAAQKGIDVWNRYSGPLFDNGSFWELNPGLGKAERAAMISMVHEMREVRYKLETECIRHKWIPGEFKPEEYKLRAGAFVRRLLIITLMVRFMEERGIIPEDYFTDQEFLGASSFKSLLRHKTPLLIALDRLARDFNGDIFTLEDREGEAPVRTILISLPDNSPLLEMLGRFADGQWQGDQKHFWKRYSFRHLPVEAISYVYEDFLGGKSQSYYTPHHLVELLLDEAMSPKRVREALQAHDPSQTDASPAFPVLDPACGSGVFLVGAWARLVEAMRLIDSSPSPETLKRLMEQNIHGVDKEADSVELTVFSLCVALCSAFPRKAGDSRFIFNKLKELKFPNLKSADNCLRNVHKGDFFQVRRVLWEAGRRFSLIIGNPPFESELNDLQRGFDAQPTDENGKQWPPVPDENLGYLFLRATPPLLAPGGSACLIQNAGLLYNDKPAALRKALLGNWHVPEILDFASIDRLFESRAPGKNKGGKKSGAEVKVVAVLVRADSPDARKPLLHVTFRRGASLNERDVFEIDPQDLHWIPRDIAASEPRIWKADLLGGGRLFRTYKALVGERTLERFLDSQEAKSNWICKEGFIVGKKTPKHHHPEVAEWKVLETSQFRTDDPPTEDCLPLRRERFHRPLDAKLFTPPHLLIKENERFPVALRLEGVPLLFRHKIIGISVPDTVADRAKLSALSEFLRAQRMNGQFFAAFGPQYLIGKRGVPLKKNIMDLPYPEDGKVEFRGIQKHLRDDVIDFMIPMIKDTANRREQAQAAARPKDVSDYSKVFLQVMQSAYPDLRQTSGPIDLGTGWCVAFHKGKGKTTAFGNTTELREHLDALLAADIGKSLRCYRIVRHFHGNDLFIVKPKPRRYWLKSAAVRDADEVFASAMNAAQSRLKKLE